MDEFEYFFTFVALLLGLALANVATGLADVWRSRQEVRLGVCTPLLGLVVMSYAVSQWQILWGAREMLAMGPVSLILVLAVVLPYIFISQAMFPRRPEVWSTLDDYYLAHRGTLLGALIFSTAIALISNYFRFSEWGLVPLVRTVVAVLAPAVAIYSANRWVHAAVLLAISAFYFTLRLF